MIFGANARFPVRGPSSLKDLPQIDILITEPVYAGPFDSLHVNTFSGTDVQPESNLFWPADVYGKIGVSTPRWGVDIADIEKKRKESKSWQTTFSPSTPQTLFP